MAGPSNSPPDVSVLERQDLYLHALHTNVSNFISVDLSSNDNYDSWKTQMLCLMEAHDMCVLVDAAFDISSSTKIVKQFDTLLKGWIFGSVSQRVLATVLDLGSAKEVWDQLKYFHAPMSSLRAQQDSAHESKLEAKEETKGKGMSTVEETKGKGISTVEETKGKGISPETETKEETKGKGISTETEDKEAVLVEIKQDQDPILIRKATPEEIEKHQKILNMQLEEEIKRGYWRGVRYILQIYGDGPLKIQAINKERNTILHLAVEKGQDDIVKTLLNSLKKEEDIKEALEMKNVDGSTALHVAAMVGNVSAAKLLVEKHEALLEIYDKKGHDPLFKTYSNLQFDTGIYFLEFFKTMKDFSDHRMKIGVDLLVNAISAKEYSTALKFVKKFPEFARGSDEVLMAIARTFPSELSLDDNDDDDDEEEEAPDYLDLGFTAKEIIKSITVSFIEFVAYWCRYINIANAPRMLLCLVWRPIFYLILIFFLPLLMLCFVLWKGATKLAPLFTKHIKEERKEAKKVLNLVCGEIDTLKSFEGTHHPYYKRPILEAACQNAHEVVDEILSRSHEAIRCKDDCGYDIIQLAVIHRSDKIYNRFYHNGESNNQYYKTIKDSSQNNMLHLAGRLAPSHKLNRIAGAALQLQRELQWREELKKFVFPAYITQENIYKETPGMVFTREHENLVKEGETWMKTTAESCSITAGLITTIVFAAAITVPGGSNQEKGTPLFIHEIAFVVFAISDAISLFTSAIALLVFLSILTARFSEQDFLVNLPRRLIIGLCSLLVSTTAMMVAFGAILFLVFGHKNPWMLVPICTTVCLTIVFFFIIQLPLILDLYRSTYVPIFVTKSKSQ